jgi:hypothetical protein
MIWFWEHGQQLFILFAFPLIGLVVDFWLSKEKTVYILITSFILLAPILTGYSYIFSWAYQFWGLIGLSCVYSFYSRQIEKETPKVMTAVIISGLLSLILGWFAFMDAFAGSQKVENKWEIDNHKIEYIRDQGFSGRPLMKYQLREYGLVPIFIKTIETSEERDTVYNCEVPFMNSKIIFNKCNLTIKTMP